MMSEDEISQLLDKTIARRVELGPIRTIDVNAPVALMQVALDAKIDLLAAILQREVDKPWRKWQKNHDRPTE